MYGAPRCITVDMIVPFSTAPGRIPIVLSAGGFASLGYLDHQAEGYRLAAGIYVDRETLLNQKLAAVVVRPGLFLNNLPVSTKLLEEVTLRIVAGDQDGILTTQEIKDVKLFEDQLATLESESAKFGTTEGDIDFALLVDGGMSLTN